MGFVFGITKKNDLAPWLGELPLILKNVIFLSKKRTKAINAHIFEIHAKWRRFEKTR